MKQKKQSRDTVKRLLLYFRPYVKNLIFSSILLLAATVIGFVQPLVIQKITDGGMLQKELSVIVSYSFVLLALVAVNQGLDFIQTYIFVGIHNLSFYKIFHQVFEKLLHLKKSFFEDKNSTEILSYLQVDVSQVSTITDQYTVMSISYVFRVISGIVGLVIISWKLALVVLSMVPIKFLLVRYFSKKQESAIKNEIETNRDFSKWFGDIVSGINEIKLWGLFKTKDKEFSQKQQKILKLQKKRHMVTQWNTFWEMILEWGVVVCLYILGGYLICKGQLTIGAVFAFVSYSGQVTGPISALINLKMLFAQIIPSAKRLFEFLDLEEEADFGKTTVISKSPKVEFKNVSFQYELSRPILRGVNFHINPGEKVAIIGPNGSGKSTIIDLLLRFLQPSEGAILVDEKPIQEYNLTAYRSLFSVVSQDPFLFHGDINENIDLTHDASEQEINRALNISRAADFVKKLQTGERTNIGNNGSKLSGGEKQKIAVARAILKSSPIIILDEATSGFDVSSNQYVKDMIVNKLHDKTIIMITHHYEQLTFVDRIYKLENGSLREVHSSTELS